MQESQWRLSKSQAVVLAGLIGVAVLLRIPSLGTESLNGDELTYRNICRDYEALDDYVNSGVLCHPPGYFLFMFTWQKVAGDSEFALRLPDAIAGTLSVLVLFLLGRYLYSAREGLIAALLMAVASMQVYDSQLNRNYALYVLLTLVSLLLWFRLLAGIRGKEKLPAKTVAAYAATAVALGFVHYYGLYFLFLQGVVLLCVICARRRVRDLGILCGAYGPVGFLYLFRIRIMLREFGRSEEVGAHINTSPHTWLTDLVDMATEGRWPLEITGFGKWIFLALVSAGLATAAVAAVRGRTFKRLVSPATLFVAMWLVLPGALIYGATFIAQSHGFLAVRYLAACAPAAYLLVARSLTYLLQRRAVGPVAAGLSALCAYNLVFVQEYYTRPQKEQVREIQMAIAESEEEYPGALVVGESMIKHHFMYYAERGGRDMDLCSDPYSRRGEKEIATRLREKPPEFMWLIRSYPIPPGEITAIAEKDYAVIERLLYKGPKVCLYWNPTGSSKLAELKARVGGQTRGLHVAVIDPEKGIVLTASRFDPYASEEEAKRAAEFLQAVPQRHLVAVTVAQEAGRFGKPWLEALREYYGVPLDFDESWWKDTKRPYMYMKAMACVAVRGGSPGSGILRAPAAWNRLLVLDKEMPIPGTAASMPLDMIIFSGNANPEYSGIYVAPESVGREVLAASAGR